MYNKLNYEKCKDCQYCVIDDGSLRCSIKGDSCEKDSLEITGIKVEVAAYKRRIKHYKKLIKLGEDEIRRLEDGQIHTMQET